MSLGGRRCNCLFPWLVFPGDCLKCNLTHEDADRLRINAVQLPFRFYSCGEISWQEYELLREQIDLVVEKIYSRFGMGILGEWSVLFYYQESIWAEVRELMQAQHGINLDEGDARRFKIIVV